MRVRYDLHYRYSGKTFQGNGVAHCNCTLLFWSKLLIKYWYLHILRGKTLYMKDYIPNKNFRGWPKKFYGKRLTIEVINVKFMGLATGDK